MSKPVVSIEYLPKGLEPQYADAHAMGQLRCILSTLRVPLRTFANHCGMDIGHLDNLLSGRVEKLMIMDMCAIERTLSRYGIRVLYSALVEKTVEEILPKKDVDDIMTVLYEGGLYDATA